MLFGIFLRVQRFAGSGIRLGQFGKHYQRTIWHRKRDDNLYSQRTGRSHGQDTNRSHLLEQHRLRRF